MSVSLDALLSTLLARPGALEPFGGGGDPALLSRQILYAALSGEAPAELAGPARARLLARAEATARPELVTRWTQRSSRLPLWNLGAEIRALAVHPLGRDLYAGLDDGRVVRLNPADPGEPPIPLGRWQDRVTVLDLSAAARMLAVGDASGGVWVLALDDVARPASRLGGPEPGHSGAVSGLTWSPDGTLVSVGEDGRVLAWDPGSGDATVLGRREGTAITGVLSAPGGVVTCDLGGQIWSWRLDGDGTRVAASEGVNRLAGIAAGQDGSTFYTTSRAGRLERWTPEGPRALGWIRGPLSPPVLGPDGGRVLAGDVTGAVLSWPVDGDPQQPAVVEVRARAVTTLVQQPNGALFIGSRDGTIAHIDEAGVRGATTRRPDEQRSLWRLAADRGAALLGGSEGLFRAALGEAGPEPAVRLCEGDIKELAVLEGGDVLAVAGDLVLLVRPDEPASRTVLARRMAGHRTVVALAAVPGTRDALATFMDGAMEYWHVFDDGGRPALDMRSLGQHTGGRGYAIAVSPRGDWAASSTTGVEVFAWSLTEGSRRGRLGFHETRVNALAISPDGGHVLVGSASGQLAVWTAQGYGPVLQLLPATVDGRAIRDLCVARDGSWVACATDEGEVLVWPWPVDETLPPVVLRPAGQPWRIVPVDGGLLVADRHQALTSIAVRVPATSAPIAADAPAVAEGDVVVIVDQWSSRLLMRGLRPGSHVMLDFNALLSWLSGGRPAVGFFAAPHIDALNGLRAIVRKYGWRIHDLSPERPAQVRELETLARRYAADHEVVLLTENADLKQLAGDIGYVVVDHLSDAVLL